MMKVDSNSQEEILLIFILWNILNLKYNYYNKIELDIYKNRSENKVVGIAG